MKRTFFLLLLTLSATNLKAQLRYSGKLETGYHFFLSRPVRYDVGPNWMGYQLARSQDGLELSFVNGISYRDKYRAGIGLGYLNYRGIEGYTIFGDLEFSPSGKRIAPLFDLKIGRSHIANQYRKGSVEAFFELTAGVEARVLKGLKFQVKGGFRAVHQSIFLPVSIGTRF